MSLNSSLSTCLLCREKAECSLSLSTDPFPPEGPEDVEHLIVPTPTRSGWTDSVADSIVELLQLDITFQEDFGKAGYCAPCRDILLDIHSTLQNLKALEAKLSQARDVLRNFFRNNWVQAKKDAAEMELLTSLNLSRTGAFHTDDYDSLVRRIYEGLEGLDTVNQDLNLPQEPLPTLVIKIPRKASSSKSSVSLLSSLRVLRPKAKRPIILAADSDDSSSDSDPSESNSSDHERLSAPEAEKDSDGQANEFESESERMTSKPATSPRICCNVESCNFSCKQENRMSLHVRTQHRGTLKPFQCDQCDLRFERQTGLRRHLRVHTKKPSIFCSVCNKGFYENWYLKRHFQAVHSEKTKLSCGFCSKSFLSKSELKAHEVLHVGVSTNCLFCDQSFQTVIDLKTHVSSEHEVPKCSQCDKVFENQRRLSKHLERSHIQAEPSFNCTLCPNVFRFRSSFAQHMNWHSTARQFVCETCGKSYKSVYCLKHHTRTHTGETPYPCDQCGKTFTSSTKLRNHSETHNQTKSYVCHQCGKCFRGRKNLSQHVARHKKGTTERETKLHPPQKRRRNKKLKSESATSTNTEEICRNP